jgi:hypothetical protein
MTLCKLTIDKSRRGWSYQSEVKYDDWPNWVNTSGGSPTLAGVLLDVIGHKGLRDAKIVSIAVKGKPMTNAEALDRIVKNLRGTGSDYSIPQYEDILSR